MMRRLLAIAFIVAIGASVGAESRPDLSGVWAPVAVKPTPSAASGVSAMPPSDITIVQTADSISLSRTAFEHVTTETHTFDGRDNTNKSGAVTRVTHSHWNGASLVT